MTYDLAISWRSLRSRPVQTIIPIVAVALAVALSVAVMALGAGVRRGIVEASDPFGVLVIGPKGDGQQLVLNSILLQGLPLGTISYEIYERMRTDGRVRLAVPLAKGDNVAGAPVIGTNANFFELRTEVNAEPAFQVAQGALFTADFEAVLGSRAAAALGLTLGESFRVAHGFESGLASDQHDDVYTIVGILHPTNSPYDNAVYTTIESVWRVHAETEANPFAVGESGAQDRLTSILVQPIGFSEQNQIWQEFYTGTEAQAVFPGQELGRLFDLLGQGEQILNIVGYLVLGIAVLTIFLAIYSATLYREREIAIMRSLGGNRTSIFRMVIFETLITAVLGAVLGRLLGYAVAAVIAAVFTGQSAIPLPISFMIALEPFLWLLLLGVSLIAGIFPAVLAYRVDVVEKLSVV